MSDDYFAAFICLHGDVDNLGVTESKSFVVNDTQGRDWICWPTDRESLRSDCIAMFSDAVAMQENLLQNGYWGTGGTLAVIHFTHLPEPIAWDEQMEKLRESLGDAADDDGEGDEWKKK